MARQTSILVLHQSIFDTTLLKLTNTTTANIADLSLIINV